MTRSALQVMLDVALAPVTIARMKTEELLKPHLARPFQPFSIRLGDGQSIRVTRPEVLAYARNRPTAVVYRRDGSFDFIDLSSVTGLEVRRASRRRTPRT